MFSTVIGWLKKFGARQGIREMDKLEPIFAAKIREAQKRLGEISPDEFAKLLVDEVQFKMCGYFGVEPAEILSAEEIANIRGK